MCTEYRYVRNAPIVFGIGRPNAICQVFREGVTTYSSLLEKVLARVFSSSVASGTQVFHVNKRRSGKHDGLEQDQANFPFAAISFVDH